MTFFFAMRRSELNAFEATILNHLKESCIILKQMRDEQLAWYARVEEQKDQLLDRYDIIQKYHISDSTIYRLKKDGCIHPIYIRRKEFYSLNEIQLLLRQNKLKRSF